MKLLMITGLGSVKDLAFGKKGAFYNTLEEFHKYWDRIDIICPKLASWQAGKLASYFGNVYVHISPWPLIFHPFWFLRKGLEIYKEQKFDLMTVQDFPPFYNGIGARLLWNKIKVPYNSEFHHIPGYPKAANWKEKLYSNPLMWKLYWRLFGSKAKAVRVVNQKQTPEFLKKIGVQEDKIKYIPSMYIDLEVFRPMDVPKQYDLIFVGRLEKNKGVDLLLNALIILSKTYNLKPRTLIIGDGSLRKSLELQATSYKLQVNFYGWATDSQEVAKLLNQSKILVMPSHNEGGPRVVLEAMACGVPVLATFVGIVPDLLKNGLGGEIIAWEADDIAYKAKGLLNNLERYRGYVLNGLETVKQFEKKEAIKGYADKLQSLT